MHYYIFCYREWFDRLTCPLSSSWLFVNFNLSKEIGCFIQWAPLAGLSGCTWILGGDTGSARPATTQALLWNAYRYLLSSHGTKSITIRYSVLGSKPNSRHCRLSKSLSFHVLFSSISHKIFLINLIISIKSISRYSRLRKNPWMKFSFSFPIILM